MGTLRKENIVKTLKELLENLESLDDELTIYAKSDPEWSPDSYAIACSPLQDGTTKPPPEAVGMEYFLEVFIAKEVVEDLESIGQTKPSLQEICNAVIHYAKYDA